MNEDPTNNSSPAEPTATQTPTAPASGPEAASASSTGLAPNVAAGLSAVFPLIGGIVFLVLEKKDAFVKFWALQSLYFGVTALVASIIVSVIGTILAFVPIIGWLIGILLWLGVTLGILALWIFGIINAFQGKRWKMPILGDMVEKQTGNTPSA